MQGIGTVSWKHPVCHGTSSFHREAELESLVLSSAGESCLMRGLGGVLAARSQCLMPRQPACSVQQSSTFRCLPGPSLWQCSLGHQEDRDAPHSAGQTLCLCSSSESPVHFAVSLMRRIIIDGVPRAKQLGVGVHHVGCGAPRPQEARYVAASLSLLGRQGKRLRYAVSDWD